MGFMYATHGPGGRAAGGGRWWQQAAASGGSGRQWVAPGGGGTFLTIERRVSNSVKTAFLNNQGIALDHFITLTAKNWPMAPLLRLWDLILTEGIPAVFASFLALLELYVLPPAGGSPDAAIDVG